MKRRVVIIGAGIGGIATANILAKAGFDVSVYEKNARAGGRAGTLETESGFRFDTGPSWYLMPDVFRQHFSLFGRNVSDELDLIKLTPAYKVFFENSEPLTITGDAAANRKTFETIEPGAGAKLDTYIEKGETIYRLSLQHFLYTNFTSPRDFLRLDVLRHAPNMLRLAFTPIDAYVRRFVQDQRLRQVLEYPMVFLGSSPFSAPAIYSLMSALDFREGVFYPQGGLYTIIERLLNISRELGVTYRFNTSVQKILTNDGVARGIVLDDGTHVEADIIISNADLHFTETKLLDAVDQSYPERYWQNREAGPSALLMYLGVSGELPSLEHHNLFFVDEWKENFERIFESKTLPHPASIYVCKPGATDPRVAPEGHENLFVLVPLPPGIELTNADDIADAYLEQLEKDTGLADLRQRIVYKKLFTPNDFSETYNAWLGTALGPSHILRQSAFFRTPNKSRRIKNLYYVGGSTTPGIGLPMCLIGAELVYKRIAGDKRGGPLMSIRQLESEG